MELAFDAQCRRLATVTAGGQAKIWNVITGREAERVDVTKVLRSARRVQDCLEREIVRIAPGGYVRAVAFASSSRFICMAVENEVELWELEAESTLRYMRSESDVAMLTFSADGSHLMATGDKNFDGIEPDSTLWEVESGKLIEKRPTRPLPPM